VFADRYHEHVLRSGAEVANAVAYVLRNHAVHALRQGRRADTNAVDLCSSAASAVGAAPRTWLLMRFGWT
jgi:hypothetical protein